MNYSLIPMTNEYARQIVGWKYEGQYAVYDYCNEAEHILDSSEWGKTLFAVLNDEGCLIGELSFGFLDETDEWVPQEKLDAGQLDGCILWIGFGLRPDLTGHGHGVSFVKACTDFAIQFSREQYGYPGRWVGLGVYEFNQRAIKVYEKAGFIKYSESIADDGGEKIPARRMKKRI